MARHINFHTKSPSLKLKNHYSSLSRCKYCQGHVYVSDLYLLSHHCLKSSLSQDDIHKSRQKAPTAGVILVKPIKCPLEVVEPLVPMFNEHFGNCVRIHYLCHYGIFFLEHPWWVFPMQASSPLPLRPSNPAWVPQLPLNTSVHPLMLVDEKSKGAHLLGLLQGWYWLHGLGNFLTLCFLIRFHWGGFWYHLILLKKLPKQMN